MVDGVLVNVSGGFWEKFREGEKLPLNVLSVAAIPDKEGYDIKIIDQRVNPNWEHDLKKYLKEEPLCVGISVITGSPITNALNVARIVKENSDSKVVFGGIHPTLMPRQTLEHDLVDIVVEGEGDISFCELIKKLEKGEKPDIDGIWYKDKKTVKHKPPKPVDLNLLTDLPYHLINIHDYITQAFGYKTISMMTSRGCPFSCKFCYNSKSKKGWRSFPMESIESNIDYLQSKAECLSIEDDNFFVDQERAKKIVRTIEGKGLKWISRGLRIDTVNKMDKDFLALMEKSCVSVAIGVESASNRLLRVMNKGIRKKDTIDANNRLKNYEIIPRYNFMLGLPTETREEVMETVDLALRLMKDNPKATIGAFSIYSPYPDSLMYDEVIKKYGFVPPQTLEGWSDFDHQKANSTWLSEESETFLRTLSITSIFLNTGFETNPTWIAKLMYKLYRPVILFRYEHSFWRFPIELWFATRMGY